MSDDGGKFSWEGRRHFAILRQMDRESDRGLAIVGAAYLEEALTALLRGSFVVRGNKLADDLLEYPGPISAFAAKIKVAYAFGLVGETAYHDLNKIRDIRNSFAHEMIEEDEERDQLLQLGFKAPRIAKLCGELWWPERYPRAEWHKAPEGVNMREWEPSFEAPPTNPRERFVYTQSEMLPVLIGEVHYRRMKGIQIPGPLFP